MNRTLVSRLEVGIDGAASAALAAAVGFAFYRWLEPWTPHPQLGTLATLAGSGTLVICWARLSWVDVRPRRFPVAMFDLGAATPSSPPELVLTDAERVDDTLLLDEPLPTVSPDSRVAQLFHPVAMPTPGALKAQIDRHLDRRQDREILEPPAPDDSQALYDALAELRRGVNRR
jgi:hypothetical protein